MHPFIHIRCLSLESELSKANSDLARLMVSVKDKDEEILVSDKGGSGRIGGLWWDRELW